MTAEFKDHFSSAAAGYAAHRPSYPRELAETLAGLSPSRQRAWDAGCGSGQLSTVLAEVFEEVAATDASAAQIASAIPHPRVRYSMAPAEASGLPERSVDCAVAAQAVHWFDLDRYYGEVRRVAKGGGLLALVTYNIMRVTDEVDWVILEFYAGPLEKHWPPERRVVEEGYRSLPFPFPEVKAPPLELHQRWTLRQMVGYVGTWSAVQSLRRSGGQAEFERFESKLEAVWGNPEVVRDYVYVEDVIDAYLLAATRPGQAPGAVYNVGTGVQTSLRDVVAVARRIMDIRAEPAWGTMPNRIWDTHVWVSDNGKTCATLGWQPNYSFEQGFQMMANWLRDHPAFLQFYRKHGTHQE